MNLFHRKPKRIAKKLSRNREDWLLRMEALAQPVLNAAANGKLHKTFPQPVSRLAAGAGVLCGLSSFLEAPPRPGEEERHQRLLAGARTLLSDLTNPNSPDLCADPEGGVEPTAFVPQNGLLAFALLKAKNALLHFGTQSDKDRMVSYFRQARLSRPKRGSEELVYAVMMELVLYELTGDCETLDIDYALTILLEHSRGDGVFAGEGEFCWDYQHCFFLYPMLEVLLPYLPRWFCHRTKEWEPAVQKAFSRTLTMQARFIAPDGSYPVLGYGMCLRSGAFHTLAHGALRELLPQELTYSCVREALYRVIKRTLTPEGTVDENGFLLPGLAGHQPSLCEPDFTRGQLYGCMAVFAPLGLPQNHAFWGQNEASSPWQKAWTGEDIPLDHCH